MPLPALPLAMETWQLAVVVPLVLLVVVLAVMRMRQKAGASTPAKK
jgi:hypothetical protein